MGIEQAHLFHDSHQILFGERVSVRPGRKTAPPVTPWGRLILEANEREARIVGDVRMWMKRRESSTEKSTITLGERAQAGQNKNGDNCRKPAAPAHAER